jgi:hypothetical protein
VTAGIPASTAPVRPTARTPVIHNQQFECGAQAFENALGAFIARLHPFMYERRAPKRT